MGFKKHRHAKDKLYIRTSEWAEEFGGYKKQQSLRQFRRLPFDSCCISLAPFDNPVCDSAGNCFELLNIGAWLKQYGTNPVTGKKMKASDLTVMSWHKNADNKYHCPVRFKEFSDNSHIVVNLVTGNVYSMEAIEQLCYKAKNFKDLINDKPFKRSDVITVQDPVYLDKFNIQSFHHLKNGLKLEDDKESKKFINKTNQETRDVLKELREKKILEGEGAGLLRSTTERAKANDPKKRLDKYSAAHFTTGRSGMAFTSTCMMPITESESALKDDRSVVYQFVKKKAYVRLTTSLGELNLELHAEYVPKTVENFLTHCKNGYYNGTIFHRNIRSFIIQGGDPTGVGNGGESIWGGKFKDEFKLGHLMHNKRGIVAMANSGPDTNGSQFFITYASCQHLDGKHTVFGRLVGGADTLRSLELAPTDKKTDRPIEDIKLLSTEVFVDPYPEAEKLLQKAREKDDFDSGVSEKVEKTVEKVKPKEYSSGVGKYINRNKLKRTNEEPSTSSSMIAPKSTKKVKNSSKLNDFSEW